MEKTKIQLSGGSAGVKLLGMLLIVVGIGTIAANLLGFIPAGVVPQGILPEGMDYLVEIIGGVIILLGIPFLLGGSKAPSVDLTEQGMIMQSGTKKGNARLPWREIKAVELKSYLVKIKTRKGIFKYEYQATPDVSKALKRAIRAFAEDKGIPVYGG